MIGPYGVPLNEVEYSRGRLRLILENERLLLNPYTLSDEELWDYVTHQTFDSELRLLQGVVITFSQIQMREFHKSYEVLPFSLCEGACERYMSLNSMMYYITADDSARRTRTLLDGRMFHSRSRVERLQGRSVFVSHIHTGHNRFGRPSTAYFMHSLKGSLSEDAAMIRRTMCEAKVEMLQRVLEYPYCPFYLSCVRGTFDFETPLRQFIATLRSQITIC